MKSVLRNIASDEKCDVHQTILGIREGKEGWFHLYTPGTIGCDDEGELWGVMVRRLSLFDWVQTMANIVSVKGNPNINHLPIQL